MKKLLLTLVFVFMMSFCLNQAQASPLALSYDIKSLGSGLYGYDFRLTLDNNDNSWVPGESWDWLIFGDASSGSSSPLGPFNPDRDSALGFVGDLAKLPIGPWIEYNYSTGGHNGPTLVNFNGGWEPAAEGETLTWSGTALDFVGQGAMLFSTLLNYAPNGFISWPEWVDGYFDDQGEWVESYRIDLNSYNYNNASFEVATLNKVTTAVPEPTTMLLLGLGLVGLAGVRRKFKK